MKSLIVGLLVCGFTGGVYAQGRVALPDDYRESFVEYLSLDRTQNPDQFIRLYADKNAMRGVDASGQLTNGSVLVAEVYSVKKDGDGKVLTSVLNRRIADELLLIAVMEKRPAFGNSPESTISTGDWDFAAYKPNGEAAAKDLDACRSCHAPLEASDYLFSIAHLPSAAQP